jgi:hypothetical protein
MGRESRTIVIEDGKSSAARREHAGAGYHKRDIGRAMDKVFEAPSPLNRIPAFVCAQCGRRMPCLGVPTP